MPCNVTLHDEENQIGFGEDALVEIEISVDYAVESASPPSWNEWSGGDPGSSGGVEVTGWSVESITVEDKPVDYKSLSEEMKKKIDSWIDNQDDDMVDQVENYVRDL